MMRARGGVFGLLPALAFSCLSLFVPQWIPTGDYDPSTQTASPSRKCSRFQIGTVSLKVSIE